MSAEIWTGGNSFVFKMANSKPVIIITPDGRIELGEGCTNAEAARALVEAANVLMAQHGLVPKPQAVDLVPPGWTIKRDGEHLRIVSPADGPGFVAWQLYHVHSFEQRMLYALAQALIDDKGPRA
ncbi:hypothetical protein [Bradyrhizobium yuanmingense]|uniref:hypothetical protein n=1 Tax=Bradyrhizobium yuanmingense TaxID=108015 RepID=UPI000567C16E|nr:hypothetical protein [Bradyrhizobium yuanmingense]